MKQITYTTQVTRPQLEIRYDQSADSPREWDNLGYFITVENRCFSPDKEPSLEYIVKTTGEEANTCEEYMKLIEERMKEEYNETLVYIVPVSKFEHSGVIYRRGERHGWDEGVVGFYIVTKESAERLGTEPQYFDKCIDGELETYTAWANGEVYGFMLYDENGEVTDSCWGFYDIDDIKEHLGAEWKDEDLSDYLKY